MNKESLNENINKQRKLMGLNEIDVESRINEDKVAGPIEEEVINTNTVLSEVNWFRHKMGQLGSYFNRNKNKPDTDNPDIEGMRGFSPNTDGAVPLDHLDHKITQDIGQNLAGAEDEYPDEELPGGEERSTIQAPPQGVEEPKFDLAAMDQNLKDAESEYPEPTPKMSAKPNAGGAKAIAQRKGKPGTQQPIKTAEPILGMDQHPTSPVQPNAPEPTPQMPTQPSVSAKSVSSGQTYGLNYNVK